MKELIRRVVEISYKEGHSHLPGTLSALSIMVPIFTTFDKNNDVFYVIGNEISSKNFHLYILDRWGGVIFETDKYDKDQPAKYGWNGSFKDGSTVSIGSYTWFVKYLDGDGIEHDRSGVVNVIK